jgi:hypothetical protein
MVSARDGLRERLDVVIQRLRPAYAASLGSALGSQANGIGFLLELGRHYSKPTRDSIGTEAEPSPYHPSGARHRIGAAREKGRRRQLELF